jgi:hypothetical protein
MRSKSFKHTALTDWLDMVESVCPICGNHIDLCAGHIADHHPTKQEETA